MIDRLLKLSPAIRYAAIYANGHLESNAKDETLGASV